LAPNLRRLGVEVEFGPRGNKGYTLTIFRKAASPHPPQSPDEVHQVHQVHSTNKINNLDGELDGELGQNPSEAKFTPHANGAGATLSSELGGNELMGEIHHEVHSLNGWEQRASEHSELGELVSEPSEDCPPYEPYFDSVAEDWKTAMGIEN
jgi:hypothetical protein